jgi:YfiH family protein
VGDHPKAVASNRQSLQAHLGKARAVFLKQVHGVEVAQLTPESLDGLAADACVTADNHVVCTIMVADCLPVLLTDHQGRAVAAAHAGWRGLCIGVLEATLEAMRALGARQITAVVGPCIGQPSYEVGADLRDAVLAETGEGEGFFIPGQRPERWQFDLPGYCLARLRAAGAEAHATFDDTLAQPEHFFSHRRRTLAGEGPIGHQLSAIGI